MPHGGAAGFPNGHVSPPFARPYALELPARVLHPARFESMLAVPKQIRNQEKGAKMEIHWVNPNVFAEGVRSRVEERILALTDGRSDVIDVRITARQSGHHRHGDQEVRITCDARGKEIVASRTRPDAGLALNEAMDVFEQELGRMRSRRSEPRKGREAHAAPPESGVIDEIRADRDHGFILTDAGERVYFHRNAVRELAFERLEEGQRVSLNLEAGDEGLQATVVRPPPPGAS